MNAASLHDHLSRLCSRLDDAQTELETRASELAVAERDYRKARAVAWLDVSGKLAKQREDDVNAVTADARYLRDLADGKRQAALESVRNLRTQVSALQSAGAAYKAETEAVRYGPQMTP